MRDGESLAEEDLPANLLKKLVGCSDLGRGFRSLKSGCDGGDDESESRESSLQSWEGGRVGLERLEEGGERSHVGTGSEDVASQQESCSHVEVKGVVRGSEERGKEEGRAKARGGGLESSCVELVAWLPSFSFPSFRFEITPFLRSPKVELEYAY